VGFYTFMASISSVYSIWSLGCLRMPTPMPSLWFTRTTCWLWLSRSCLLRSPRSLSPLKPRLLEEWIVRLWFGFWWVMCIGIQSTVSANMPQTSKQNLETYESLNLWKNLSSENASLSTTRHSPPDQAWLQQGYWVITVLCLAWLGMRSSGVKCAR